MVLEVAWSSEELAGRLCDSLVEKGLMKAKPAFIRKDREALYSEVFRKAGLDGQMLSMWYFRDRASLEQVLKIANDGEASAWLESVTTGLLGMLDVGVAGQGIFAHALPDSATTCSHSGDKRPDFVFEGCDAVAKQICDNLVEKGLLKAKPAFIRSDREAQIAEVFRKAGLDEQTLSTFRNSMSIERWLLQATSGETCAWLQSVAAELIVMLHDGNVRVRTMPREVSAVAMTPTPRIEQDLEQLVVQKPSDLRPEDFDRLARRICDKLVEKGLLKSKPAFIRTDREAKISEAFRSTGLDAETLSTIGERSAVEKLLLDATSGQGCAWVENVSITFMEMLEEGETMVELAKQEDETSTNQTAEAEQVGVSQTSSPTAKGSEDNSPRSIASLSTSTSQSLPKTVSFSAEADEICDILLPYSEIYGVHPSEFDFDEFGQKVSNDPTTSGRLVYP